MIFDMKCYKMGLLLIKSSSYLEKYICLRPIENIGSFHQLKHVRLRMAVLKTFWGQVLLRQIGSDSPVHPRGKFKPVLHQLLLCSDLPLVRRQS